MSLYQIQNIHALIQMIPSLALLESINLDAIRFKGYAFQIEMKFTVWKMGFKIEEVPIIFTDRKLGKSKMSGGIFNEAFFGVLKMKWRSFFQHFPQAA